MKWHAGAVRPRAVVLGAGVNALGIVRALGAAQIPAIVVHSDERDERFARYSRHCTAIRVPGSESGDRLLQVLLSRPMAGRDREFLFATSDYHVSFISRHRESLAERYAFNIPGRDVLALLIDKERSAEAAAAAGLVVPQTVVPEDPQHVGRLAEGIRYPCIIKPRDSFSVAFPGKNAVADARQDFIGFFRRHPDLCSQAVVQEIVPGGEGNIFQCTSYVAGSGNPLVHFTMRKIHQFPPGYGITTLGISQQNDALVEFTDRFLRHVGLVGFASVEYKRSSVDGRYYFIEANPRLPWYNSMFLAAGVNFPCIAVTGEPATRPGPGGSRSSRSVQWVYFRNELAGWWATRRKTQGERFRDLFRALHGSRAFAYWRLSDPLPFVMAAFDFAGWLIRRLVSSFKRDGLSKEEDIAYGSGPDL